MFAVLGYSIINVYLRSAKLFAEIDVRFPGSKSPRADFVPFGEAISTQPIRGALKGNRIFSSVVSAARPNEEPLKLIKKAGSECERHSWTVNGSPDCALRFSLTNKSLQ